MRGALRDILRHPGFAAAVICILAVGMASVTTVWSVFESVLVRPLPLPAAENLVWLGFRHSRSGDLIGPSLPLLARWRAVAPGVASAAGWVVVARTLSLGGEPQRVGIGEATWTLFHTLGVRPELGRDFTAADDQPGAPVAILLSDSLWRAAFGGAPDIAGRSIELDGVDATIIGVMPRAVSAITAPAVAWGTAGALEPFIIHNERVALWGAVARLTPDAAADVARAALAALAVDGGALRQAASDSLRPTVLPLRDVVVGDARTVLALVLGASVLVLAIACANVAGLLLARASSRRLELAVRRAIGASRARLATQLLTESAAPSAVAAVIALLIAPVLVVAIRRLSSSVLPRAADIAVRPTVFAVVAALLVLTTVACGLIPALLASRGDAADALRGGVTDTAGRHRVRTRDVLIAAELALTVVLLAGAGVLARSVFQLLGRPTGMRTEHMIVAGVQRPLGEWITNKEPARAFGRALVAKLDAIPGVSAAAVSLAPPAAAAATDTVRAGDYSAAANWNSVSTEYVRALGIAVLRGRGFDSRDAPDSANTIIVSATLARRLFGAREVVGQTIFVPDVDHPAAPWQPRRIVGVVADVASPGIARPKPPDAYLPFERFPTPHMTILVRSTLSDAAALNAIRRSVRSLDPAQAVTGGESLDDLLTESVARPRFYLGFLGAFAVASLLLAGAGVFAAISFAVQQRRREIGIRIAIGAAHTDIARLVLGRVTWLLLWGLALGLAGAWGTTRFLRSVLSGVSPTDPVVLESVCVLLTFVTIGAALAPLRTALRVDPVRTLNTE